MDRSDIGLPTGRISFRTPRFSKKCVLRVEVYSSTYSSMKESWVPGTEWRDATAEDLLFLAELGSLKIFKGYRCKDDQ